MRGFAGAGGEALVGGVGWVVLCTLWRWLVPNKSQIDYIMNAAAAAAAAVAAAAAAALSAALAATLAATGSE